MRQTINSICRSKDISFKLKIFEELHGRLRMILHLFAVESSRNSVHVGLWSVQFYGETDDRARLEHSGASEWRILHWKWSHRDQRKTLAVDDRSPGPGSQMGQKHGGTTGRTLRLLSLLLSLVNSKIKVFVCKCTSMHTCMCACV